MIKTKRFFRLDITTMISSLIKVFTDNPLIQVETQSQHSPSGEVNAVKTYSLSYSQDASVWTPYQVNGATKVFGSSFFIFLSELKALQCF